MKNYAVLDNNSLVSNVIVAASLEIAESATSCHCVLVPIGTFVSIGWSYTDGVFVDPNAPDTPEEETPA
jgi:hypothetical protein